MFKKVKIFLFVCLLFFSPVFSVQAQFLKDTGQIEDQAEALADKAGFEIRGDESAIGDVVALVIKAFLGLLGIIFVVLIVYAGYNWMTAGGNEQRIEKAQHLISRAIIGLIITLSAYSITYFIFDALGHT